MERRRALELEQQMVYLLHFDRPISPDHTCQHYIGWATDLAERINEHRAGNGARLTEVAAERGIGFTVARTWTAHDGPCLCDARGGHCRKCRELERKLKAQHNGPRLCPICNGECENDHQ